jgi:DUF1680 family protein
MKIRNIIYIVITLVFTYSTQAQENGLVNTTKSKNVKLYPIGITDVKWTEGFWAERFEVCANTMVPHMMEMYYDDSISHGFANFEIAAGLKSGSHLGPPFHDGDFYKILEALIIVQAYNQDKTISKQIDSVISIISKTQREDGYIHTPVVIEQKKDVEGKKEFGERLDFETYNMGHLMTAACIHYRTTGKTTLLDVAKKATDFLYDYYKRKPAELAQNAICPSHYMGVTEMYRTTGNPKYLELARGLIDIRSMVVDGTDHNQDRIPFKKQTEAIGHAVRANYLYAGAADVYAETGEDSLLMALQSIWNNLVERKMYITGACGALYDGVSPNGTTYDQPSIQQVHQAYGQDYQLPNLSAHNESCANIGNLLWNWRMLLSTADAKYVDVIETVLYNSLLAGVSLDGKGYFYTNPLAVSQDLPYNLRWSKEREGYISYCNCCPPNTIRTIAEVNNYMYNLSDSGIWFNLYGGSKLNTTLLDGSEIKIEQITEYPWEGKVMLKLEKIPKNEMSMYLRVPGWCSGAEIYVNEEKQLTTSQNSSFVEIRKKWRKGDVVMLNFHMEPMLIQANPLVEEAQNQVAVQRGPVVYCLESEDIPDNYKIQDIVIPSTIQLQPRKDSIRNATLYVLEGEAKAIRNNNWDNTLYRKVTQGTESVQIKLIPYYAWGNRKKVDMNVWLPLSR